MRRTTALIAVTLIALSLALPTVTVGASQYQITIDNSIDIPTRTTTIEGTEYQVSNVAQRNPGQSLPVDVTAPSSTSEYQVYLYNEKGDIIDTSSAKTGDGQATFQTDNLDPSSYYVAVYESGIQKIHPVVIAGYDVTLTAPDSVTKGNSASMTVEVTRTAASDSPPRVEVVLGDETEAKRVNASLSESGSYEATMSTADLSTGSYQVYGVVRGSQETSDGRDVVLGVSSSQTLNVTDSQGSTGGNQNDGSTDDTDEPDNTVTTTATPSEPVTQTATATATETSPPATSSTDTATATATQTDEDVIDPNPTGTESATTTTTSQPGVGLTVVFGTVLATFLIRRWMA